MLPTGSAFWFEIVKSDEMNVSPVVDKSTNASAGEAEVKKRKLPSWMNAQVPQDSKKMRNDDNAVTVSNDGDTTIATDDTNVDTNHSESTLEICVQNIAMESPLKEPAAQGSPSKRKMPTMDDGNDRKRTRGDENESTATSDSVDGSVDATADAIAETDMAVSTGNEPNDQMDVPNEPAENESNEEANVPTSEDRAAEASNAATDPRAPADLPAQLEPSTSTADESDDDALTVPLPKIQIKPEPMDDIEPSGNDGATAAGPSGLISVKQEFKKEVKTEPDADPKLRDCCPYGNRCYR